jgi:hypothetical protein
MEFESQKPATEAGAIAEDKHDVRMVAGQRKSGEKLKRYRSMVFHGVIFIRLAGWWSTRSSGQVERWPGKIKS